MDYYVHTSDKPCAHPARQSPGSTSRNSDRCMSWRRCGWPECSPVRRLHQGAATRTRARSRRTDHCPWKRRHPDGQSRTLRLQPVFFSCLVMQLQSANVHPSNISFVLFCLFWVLEMPTYTIVRAIVMNAPGAGARLGTSAHEAFDVYAHGMRELGCWWGERALFAGLAVEGRWVDGALRGIRNRPPKSFAFRTPGHTALTRSAFCARGFTFRYSAICQPG